MADWTDADRELVAEVLWRFPSKTTTRAAATSVLDTLTAAGWRPVAPYRRRIAALEDLLGCYRTGKRPSESLHRRLSSTRAELEGDHSG